MDVSNQARDLHSIDIAGVMRILPHRYPFLLLDRVVEIIRGESGVGIKNVTINEEFFDGHFPGQPVMPGVLMVEAMAQTAAVLVMDMLGDDVEVQSVYFMSIENAKFRRPVVPGDQLRLACQRIQSRANVHRYRAVGRVDGGTVAEATITAMVNYAKKNRGAG
jgi:3-hydroxyacyl-[acyl-carrier-protein] dehydratase